MSHPAVRVIVFLLAVASVGGGWLPARRARGHGRGRARRRTRVREPGARGRVLVERLRTAQQSYVAEGQGADYWMGKLADTRASLERTSASLASTATAERAQAGRAPRARPGRPARAPRRAGADLHEAGAAADGVGPDLHRDQRHDGRDRAAHRPGAHGAAHGLRLARSRRCDSSRSTCSAAPPHSACCARCCSSRGAGPPAPEDTREALRVLMNDGVTRRRRVAQGRRASLPRRLDAAAARRYRRR